MTVVTETRNLKILPSTAAAQEKERSVRALSQTRLAAPAEIRAQTPEHHSGPPSSQSSGPPSPTPPSTGSVKPPLGEPGCHGGCSYDLMYAAMTSCMSRPLRFGSFLTHVQGPSYEQLTDRELSAKLPRVQSGTVYVKLRPNAGRVSF